MEVMCSISKESGQIIRDKTRDVLDYNECQERRVEMMKKFICLIVVLLLLVSVSVSFARSTTAGEWQAAPYKMRLAAAVKWIKAASGYEDVAEAKKLERCVTDATNDPKLYRLNVDDVATSCLILMGYK
jgi:hypothetical protein